MAVNSSARKGFCQKAGSGSESVRSGVALRSLEM